MNLSVRGFLVARYTAMLIWAVALIGVGLLTHRVLAPHVASDVVRSACTPVAIGLTVVVGLKAQDRALRWLDPTGDLRRAVAEQSRMSGRPL